MYTVYTSTEDKTTDKIVGESAVFEVLKSSVQEQNMAIIRCPSDREYLKLMMLVQEKTKKAMAGAQLSGGAQNVWVFQPGNLYVDGPGWRIILLTARVEQQVQPSRISGLRG
jgi:hypothetical protein